MEITACKPVNSIPQEKSAAIGLKISIYICNPKYMVSYLKRLCLSVKIQHILPWNINY